MAICTLKCNGNCLIDSNCILPSTVASWHAVLLLPTWLWTEGRNVSILATWSLNKLKFSIHSANYFFQKGTCNFKSCYETDKMRRIIFTMCSRLEGNHRVHSAEWKFIHSKSWDLLTYCRLLTWYLCFMFPPILPRGSTTSDGRRHPVAHCRAALGVPAGANADNGKLVRCTPCPRHFPGRSRLPPVLSRPAAVCVNGLCVKAAITTI